MKVLTAVLLFSLAVPAVPCLADYVVTAYIPNGRFALSDLNAIADFDGDGQLEIVIAEPNVRIYNAMTGQMEAEVTHEFFEFSYCATAVKLDDDLLPEIVVFRLGGGNSNVYNGYVVIDFVAPAAAPSQDAPIAAAETTIRPNPFNPSATIDYSIPRNGAASLQIYDAAGRLVRNLVDGKVEPGKQSVTWDGRDNTGQVLPSGTYFYSLSLDGQVLDKGKAVILK